MNLSLGNVAAQESCLRAAGFSPIIDLPVIQRLSGISFLSGLDFVYDIKQPSTRFEHTISTSLLALKLGEQLNLTGQEKTALVIAYLLHDAGHAPFSHNAEPFMLEQRRLYHRGYLTVLLRDANGGMGNPIRKVLEQWYPDVTSNVFALMVKRKSDGVSPSRVVDLFEGPLNCDKIEGNARTLKHLDMEFIHPFDLLSCFVSAGDNFAVDRTQMALILRFWELEEQVYWKRIYVPSVFAVEAMLTRALHQVFKAPQAVASFANSTDEQVLQKCRQDPFASHLVDRIKRGMYLRPLSANDPEILDRYRDEFLAARFDMDKRCLIESKVAKFMGSEFAVSHFSRRKYFPKKPTLMHQLDLFDKTPGALPLSVLREALSGEKISGDFFDVFY